MTKNNPSPKTRDLVVTRVFDAPIELVWKPWAEPEHVMKWWGPDHVTSPSAVIDFREIMNADAPKVIQDEAIGKLFAGKKEKWRKPYDTLAAKLSKLGTDVTVGTTSTYISLLRNGKKFGIVMPSAAERLDIGIKFKGVAPTARLESAGTWHNMVTHRVRINDPKEIDKEVLAWLKQAYDIA